MKKLGIFFAVLLSSVLMVFGPSTARAVPISDVLEVIFDGTTYMRTINEVPGERVTDDIAIQLSDTSPFNNATAYLIERGTVTDTYTDGTVKGDQSDVVTLHVDNNRIHITLGSDETGRSNPRIGYLETGSPQDITLAIFGTTTPGGHTVQVLVTSDVEATTVPEPTSMLLLGLGLVGLAGVRRKIQK